jgi:transposase
VEWILSSISLDAFVGPRGPARSFANNAGGIGQLAKFRVAHEVKLVAVLHPREARQFAKAMGSREKTDGIDERKIARFAEVQGSRPTQVASPTRSLRNEREERASARSGRKDSRGENRAEMKLGADFELG